MSLLLKTLPVPKWLSTHDQIMYYLNMGKYNFNDYVYATHTPHIFFKYLKTDNVVTKYSYKMILQSRSNKGDKLATYLLSIIDKSL